MIINVPERYLNDIDNSVIDEILQLLNLNDDYKVEVESRNGRNIIITTETRQIYVILSGADASAARNAFLNQSISTVLKTYTFDSSPLFKEIYVFLMDVSSYEKHHI